jgi:hypothetical protein
VPMLGNDQGATLAPKKVKRMSTLFGNMGIRSLWVSVAALVALLFPHNGARAPTETLWGSGGQRCFPPTSKCITANFRERSFLARRTRSGQ